MREIDPLYIRDWGRCFYKPEMCIPLCEEGDELSYITFENDADWKIYSEELEKVGLDSNRMNQGKLLGVKLASGVKGEEYASVLKELSDWKRLKMIAHLRASSRILAKRAEELVI